MRRYAHQQVQNDDSMNRKHDSENAGQVQRELSCWRNDLTVHIQTTRTSSSFDIRRLLCLA